MTKTPANLGDRARAQALAEEIEAAEYAVIRLDELVEWEANPREITEADAIRLATGIGAVGWGADVLVQKSTRRIIGGHLRKQAARKLGLEAVPCKLLDVDDARAAEIALLDNRASEFAGWSDPDLAALLEGMAPDRREAIGWTGGELDALVKSLEEGGGRGGASTGPTLADRFLVPPFTVLDARQGYWTARKTTWLDLGIQSEVGREGALTFGSLSGRVPDYYAQKRAAEERLGRKLENEEFEREHLTIPEGTGLSSGGTSVFDPVLCELAVRWFCPPGGSILDPFAGGSVRGVVAAKLGRRYHGVELREDQVEANRAQWAELRTDVGISDFECEGFDVHSDHLLPGGTKRAALERLLAGEWDPGGRELVYASPAYGFAQVAMAEAARAHGLAATVFVAKRKVLHPATAAARRAGAKIVEIPAGYLKNVQAKARAYVEEDPDARLLLPFGLDAPEYLEALAEHVRSTRKKAPREVWCATGSGTLARAIQRAWPKAKVHAVVVGKKDSDLGKATRYEAPEAFERRAKDPPPFPSNANYDAKAWRFIREHGSPGALFWNVAADADHPIESDPAWTVGDARDVLPTLPAESVDLVFSCPPYGDLERYSDDPADLSTMEWDAFLEAYRTIVEESVRVLRTDRFSCFVVGDLRDRAGFYRNFVSETIRAFEDAGARLYNEAIFVTQLGSLPIRAGRMFEAGRKLGKNHQHVLVFVKGDPKAAADATPIDIDPEALALARGSER